ncbi:MAG: penicillin-binding protein 2 [Candidatus Gottesmanbacteria bacterium]
MKMWRIWSVFSFFVLCFVCIIVRLFYWQIISGNRLKAEAAAQHMMELTLPAERGPIITSDGYPLVMNKTASLVYAEPKNITNIPTYLRLVSQILEIPEATLSAMVTQPNRVWVPIAHKVDVGKTELLTQASISGIGFVKEPKRYYPEASMAAHLLGFVGLDQNGTDKGYFGLEGFYQRELQGKAGSITIEKDVSGTPILIGESVRVEPENGSTFHLWLDRTIQHIVETKLKQGIEKYGAKEGSVVVMDPKTGGILAMASYPSYDPGKYKEYDKEFYKNPIVASSYEPGSTFKALVLAAAIDAGVIKANTEFDEKGPTQIGEYTIRTWNNEYLGPITMTQVLEHSSNVGMVFAGRKLGKDKFIKFIKDIGFGTLTNIDLEDEATPELRSDKSWKEIDLATASFGQGIAATPLQMVRATAAIANGGWLMEPRMVRSITYQDGKTNEIQPKKVRQLFSNATAGVVTEMMIAAVDNGEAKWAKPKGYRIAGKTGTAQIPVAGHYDATKTIASFVGFAPADNPRFVMLVTLREPTSSPWGSETAAPLFFNIAKDIFLYLGIPAQ